MSLVTTYQMRLPRGPHEAVLDRMAAHLGQAERLLHRALVRAHREATAEIQAAGGPAAFADLKGADGKPLPGPLQRRKNEIKVRFLAEHGISGRHYNSLLRGLEGRYDGLREAGVDRLDLLRDRLRKLDKKIADRGKTLSSFATVARAVAERARAGKGPTKAQAKKLLTRPEIRDLRFVQHHQKRRARTLRDRIAALEADLARDVPAVVFGGKSLLAERSRIHPNDQQAIAAWRRRWDRSRAAGFLAMGSKDETAGCQTCVGEIAADGRLSLRLRLPDAICAEDARHLFLKGLGWPIFGRDQVTAALRAHQTKSPERRAVSYRFVRDADWPERNALSAWRVCVTVDVVTPEIPVRAFETGTDRRGEPVPAALGRTDAFRGAIAADVNADHIAWAMIDRHGNPVRGRSGRIALPLRGKSAGHRTTLIGNAARDLVAIAAEAGLPLVLERLDFRLKKRAMAERGAGYARMLSAFAYAAIQRTVRRRAAAAGVELVDVNPAYTSLIGRTNYAKRYGLSAHVSAAVAIARRAARFSERISHIHGSRGRRHTLPTRSESRRHVWRQWALVLRDEVAARKRDAWSRPAAGAAKSASSPTPRGAKGGGVRSGPSGAPARGGGVRARA